MLRYLIDQAIKGVSETPKLYNITQLIKLSAKLKQITAKQLNNSSSHNQTNHQTDQ